MYLHWQNDTQQWQPSNLWPGSDRALNYGDGLFETLRFNEKSNIPLWGYHKDRINNGLQALDFPSNSLAIIAAAIEALPLEARLSAGKLLISRGSGERGYAYDANASIKLLWHSFVAPQWAVERFPQGFQASFSSVQLSRQPLLAGIKHLNRLEQVLARSRFADNCQEMVLTDTTDLVVEGCMSNLFILQDGQLVTPEITHCGVRGVIRQWLIKNHSVKEQPLHKEDLLEAEALFFCNSLNGIIPVLQLEQKIFSSNSASWQQIIGLQRQLENVFC